MQLFNNKIYLCNYKINIMKYSLAFIFFIAFYTATIAQSHTSTVEYLKVNRQAVINDIPFPEKTIHDAIDNKMALMGYRGKDSKGFTVYKGVKLAALGNDSYDLYFKAERKGRKDKENSTLTLLILKGFDTFVADSTDAAVMNNAKGYLDSIRNIIAAYDLEQQIIEQEDAIKNADKKFSLLVGGIAILEKKRMNIEIEIENIKKEQASQLAAIEIEKGILNTLRGKRRQ